MFSSLSKFHASLSTLSVFFTDSSAELFPPSDSAIFKDLNDLTLFTSTSSESTTSVDVVPNPPLKTLCRSDRIQVPPSHLNDHRCFSVILFLREP